MPGAGHSRTSSSSSHLRYIHKPFKVSVADTYIVKKLIVLKIKFSIKKIIFSKSQTKFLNNKNTVNDKTSNEVNF